MSTLVISKNSTIIEKFIKINSGLRKFLSETVLKCRNCEYVETISGRKRYLPKINSLKSMSKAHVSITNFSNLLKNFIHSCRNFIFKSFLIRRKDKP